VDLARRAILAAGLGVLAAACSRGASDEESPTAPASPSSTALSPSDRPTSRATSPATSPATGPAVLPEVTPWRPGPGELAAACKLAAVRRIEAAGNGQGAALQVVDAQYGGLLTDSASVLVVTRSWHLEGDRVLTGGETYDVRLNRSGAAWRVTAVHPSRPGAPAGTLTRSARRVLGSDRITLPPAAVRDIRSGRVHESVLLAMLTVSRTHRTSVSVVRSGHPRYVFGTSRLSDHPQGRAFDTWAIDGHAVVDPRTSRALVEDYMHAVANAGSYNVGGPYLLGAAPQWFSDDTHHDHVHAGFAA
jgi:hypothetical protein